ncbi:hypothetical protein [Cyanobacterium sp. Dongsha4]|uniref:hypothetical protein n=1 Tax=Cyanobacterium sp. DS4 TaxID=2878255 RepID=UPI002E80BA0C|nr:hypothetical protein [Cyanobacterium sp. Dongsha4]WVL00155.1 hypothetical protein Dongsha4_16095 [Cyanobacterium sp. Dongsha4]
MNSNNIFFSDLNHELLIPLHKESDIFLWEKWQSNPSKARYLVEIFIRYHKLINDCQENYIDKVSLDKYYKQIWFYIIDNLLEYPISEETILRDVIFTLSKNFFQEHNVIYNSFYINPIDYDLLKKYIPLIYFLNKSLNKLNSLERLTIVAIDKFGWQEEKLIEYLRQHQQNLTIAELKSYYTKGYSNLINNLPTDIIAIYLQNDD